MEFSQRRQTVSVTLTIAVTKDDADVLDVVTFRHRFSYSVNIEKFQLFN